VWRREAQAVRESNTHDAWKAGLYGYGGGIPIMAAGIYVLVAGYPWGAAQEKDEQETERVFGWVATGGGALVVSGATLSIVLNLVYRPSQAEIDAADTPALTSTRWSPLHPTTLKF
jgi:hypothetical protein